MDLNTSSSHKYCEIRCATILHLSALFKIIKLIPIVINRSLEIRVSIVQTIQWADERSFGGILTHLCLSAGLGMKNMQVIKEIVLHHLVSVPVIASGESKFPNLEVSGETTC